MSQGRTVLVQGRIVWVCGDLFKGRPKVDMNTKQPFMTPDGRPVIEYGFGLAVPKSILNQTGSGQPGEVWAAMHEEAVAVYPSRQIPPGFAMKYKDGDGLDDKGVPFSQREGYAGHIVLACTTRIPIKFFKWENGQNIMVNEGIKCGDYVNVQLNVKGHGAVGTAKAGLYVSPYAVQFLGYGKEIVSSPNGDSIFGNAAPAVPQGASATPLAPSGLIVPMPNQAPAPHYGVLPQALQPQQPMAPQAPQGFPQQPMVPQAPQGFPQQPMVPQAPQGFPQFPGAQ